MRLHVKAIKYIILLVALLLLSILLIYTQPQVDLVPLPKTSHITVDDNNEPAISKIKERPIKKKASDLVDKTITQFPNYTGEDENSKVWKLKAEKAVQSGKAGKGVTMLETIIAKTLSSKNSKIDYIADKGKYIPEENKVSLKGNVVLKSDTLNLKTEELEYNLKTGFAETKTKVVIISDFGTLEGDTLKSYDNAERIILIGNVHALLHDLKKKKDK